MGFHPLKSTTTISAHQISQMRFPDRYHVGDPVQIFAISSDQLRAIASLPETILEPIPRTPEIEENTDEAAVN